MSEESEQKESSSPSSGSVASTCASPALEMTEVTVPSMRDPSVAALKQVNWTVEMGEFWAIGGLVRSGKSDLLALAAGLIHPSLGAYRLFGKQLLEGYEDEGLQQRLRIGLVFDGGQLLHHLTLAENIALPLQYHHGDREEDSPKVEERLEALMGLTGLEPWADSYPQQVTRTWQQRIGLARALALSPEVLLLDSPLSGLDFRDAVWWLEVADKLAEGHPVLGGRSCTMVVTGDALGPWITRTRAQKFAILRDQEFIPLGTREDLAGHSDQMLQELLSPSVLQAETETTIEPDKGI
jgi:ABC-type sulfate/molybdate transport systems ATPase subunit